MNKLAEAPVSTSSQTLRTPIALVWRGPLRFISACWRRIRWAYIEIAFILEFVLPPLILSYSQSRHLELLRGLGAPKSRRALVAVAPYYGNEQLLPSFLNYYRRLGVDTFVFLDLSRKRNLAEILSAESDVAIWRPRAGRPLRGAIHWLNHLRRRYGIGRWCLSVEPTEFFVFPRSETRHLRDLIEFLEIENRNHIYALRLDAYGERPASAMTLGSADPLKMLPYFDPVGYACEENGLARSVITRGGVQRRTVFRDEPRRAPALHRIPLVKWRWSFSYLAGTRLMAPRHPNTAHSRWHLSPTACLLSCALLDDKESLAVAEEVERAVCRSDGETPNYAGLFGLRHELLKHSASVRFASSKDLLDWGLMTSGQWF